MPTDPSMGFEYPDVNGDGDAWGTILNDALETIGAHSHVPGQGEPVKSAGLRIDDDVIWGTGGSYFAILEARALGLRPQPASSVVGDLNVFYVDQANGNLYFNNNGNIPVRLINGNQLDITLVGGIVGDYAAAGAEVAFIDADDAYTFRQQTGSPKAWAYMRCGPVDLYEPVSGVNQRVRLRSPVGLVSSYEVVFPGALPGSTVAVQLASSGQLSASNTFAGNLTAPDFRYTGTVTLDIPPSAATATNAVGTPPTYGLYNWVFGTSTNAVVYPVSLPVGCRLLSWNVRAVKTTSAATTVTAQMEYAVDGTGGNLIGTTQTNSANNPGAINLGVSGLSHDIVAGRDYMIIIVGGGVAGDGSYQATVTFTRP